MFDSRIPVDLIPLLDAELPQTQCGLCGHPAGCLPYATAMAEQHEPANKCVPGGQPVADRLAQLLGRPAQVVDPSDWPIAADGRPQRVSRGSLSCVYSRRRMHWLHQMPRCLSG